MANRTCEGCGGVMDAHRREMTTDYYCEDCCREESVPNDRPYRPYQEAAAAEAEETFRMRMPKEKPPKKTSRDVGGIRRR